MSRENGARPHQHRRSKRSTPKSDVASATDHPPRRGGTATVPLAVLIDYCRTHSLRDAGKHFGLSHSTICERLRDAGFGGMLASAKKAQAALARFGMASDGRVRRIGSTEEQLTAIQGDTLGLALEIMQKVRAGQVVHIEEREFALKVLNAEAQQIAIATAVQEKLYMVRSAKAILDEVVDVIRSSSEPTKRELYEHMLRQAEKRGLFGPNRPFAGNFGSADGGGPTEPLPGGVA